MLSIVMFCPLSGAVMFWCHMVIAYLHAACCRGVGGLLFFSIPHEICTWFCCGYPLVGFMWSIHSYLQLPQCWGSNPEFWLTHWGWVTHMCVCNLTIIGSDNGLSPGRRQAIILTNAGILLIVPLGTNFSEIFNDIHTFSFKKMYLKRSSAKWRPFCLGLNVLSYQ